jgi:RNA polymerase sigma factor (sigma-70 family)
MTAFEGIMRIQKSSSHFPNMTIPSDSHTLSLIQQIAQLDRTALSALYDRYARILYAVAFKSLGSVEEAEEVVLDVFSQVWRSAGSYDPAKSRVEAWLFVLTRSRVLDRLRARQRVAKKVTASQEVAQIQRVEHSVDPIETAIADEQRDHVLTALGQLPNEQRQVIELAYYQGLSHREIADKTGISLGTAKTRIRLGLSKLRSALRNWEESG